MLSKLFTSSFSELVNSKATRFFWHQIESILCPRWWLCLFLDYTIFSENVLPAISASLRCFFFSFLSFLFHVLWDSWNSFWRPSPNLPTCCLPSSPVEDRASLFLLLCLAVYLLLHFPNCEVMVRGPVPRAAPIFCSLMKFSQDQTADRPHRRQSVCEVNYFFKDPLTGQSTASFSHQTSPSSLKSALDSSLSSGISVHSLWVCRK